MQRSVGRIFRGFGGAPLKAKFGTAVPTYYDKIKKHGIAVLFVCIECWGYPPQTPDTRNFSGKVSWNFKSFAKIKWCVRQEILLPTFLIRKVGSFAYFSPKEK